MHPSRAAAALFAAIALVALTPSATAADAPQIVPTITGTLGNNGWYRSNVTIDIAISGGGPNTTSTCLARYVLTATGRVTCSVSDPDTGLGATFDRQFNVDKDAPGVTASFARAANTSGWYTAPVGISFSGTDAISGIASCSAAMTYSGPDNASASQGGSCTDRAGNTGTTSANFRYDATAPTVTPSLERGPNATGWYTSPVKVSFNGGDATSGIATCAAQVTYNGPDSATANVPGSCTDQAGNTTTRSATFAYDATAPTVSNAAASRAPDANGWYNHALPITFTSSDATSGVAGTCNSTTYSGPDSPAASTSITCKDNAGNTSSALTFGNFRYDATKPSATASFARAANASGWYTAPVGISFSGTDATSGPVSCSATVTYSGPDSGTASQPGSCTDQAGNTGTTSASLKYDATAPTVTPSLERGPNATGWYTAPVKVSFIGNDATSGIATCPAQVTYSGPDSATANVPGSCSDRAGNTTTRSATFGYDATAPTVSNPVASRAPDVNGWYNRPLPITFTGTDATSGIAGACNGATYAGPDSATASTTFTCKDNAGNTSNALTFSNFKYDATPPVVANATPDRQPDRNGWYNHPVTIGFSSSDATSGLESACSSVSYAGPDSVSASASISCRDRAGNTSAPLVLGLRYDATAPIVVATPDRAPNATGWYTAPVAVSFADGSGSTAPVTCDGSKTYSGGDAASANVTGSCTDEAGNSAVGAATFGYDATAPVATGASADRAPDANGWFNHALTVRFGGTDATSGLEGCTSASYNGPDAASASVSGSCRDNAGNVGGAGSFAFKFDATAPSVHASPARVPDANGWYNHALTVGFDGTDAVSGVATCSSTTYDGPDTSGRSLGGTCTDTAGNVASGSVDVKYDATPPSLRDVKAVAGDRRVSLTWKASADTVSVKVVRTLGAASPTSRYTGRGRSFVDGGLVNGKRYRYTVTATDTAGNAVSAVASGVPRALYAPLAGARVTAGPLLRWEAVPKATYYNVQVMHKGKVLSTWPVEASLRMPESWRFRGRDFRLERGVYRWYVWPGFGARAEKDYGQLLGSSFFIVVEK